MGKNQKLTMQEPLIKIGLVLPEDSMKVLTIKISKPSSFLITGSEKDYDPKSSNKLIFKSIYQLSIFPREIKNLNELNPKISVSILFAVKL